MPNACLKYIYISTANASISYLEILYPFMLIYFNAELPCKISKSVPIGFCTQPVTVLSSDETRTNRSRNFFGTVLVLIPRPKSQICRISQDREISWLRRHTSMRLWNILMTGFVFKTRSIYNDTTTDTLRYLAKV